MCKRACFLFLFCFLCFSWALGQKSKYRMFKNINLGTGTSVISCFLQDNQGLIWIGSNKGLFSYNGYTVQPHFTFDEKSNTQIYCGVIVDQAFLFLGADNGVLIYNIKTDRYEKKPVDFPTDVRTMSLQGDTLWLGTLNGLYWFNLNNRKLKYFDQNKYENLPHQTIYTIIRTHDNRVYIGTYDGLCRYLPDNDDFQKIELPFNPRKNNQFINSLLEDSTRQCIWIGMEGNLLKYNLEDRAISRIEMFQDNSVKSLALDGNSRLLAGTDNGLYIYSETEPLQHVMHDSRNLNSLYNNIIWNIFADQDQNIWLGTDYGISLSRYNRALQYVPISDITGTGEGNQFYSIFRDSGNNYWFGGTNGIIRVNKTIRDRSNAIWYTMGGKKYPLPHGRIRHIYEDRDSNLWIASDGNINRYDYDTRQFIQYNILDSTGTYNTNWAYCLFEDDHGQLWIATCLGGIFVVNKDKLLKKATGSYVADYNYTTKNGLSGMFINQIISDHEGNVWVLLYNNGIDKINNGSRKVEKLPLGELTGTKNPTFIFCDHSGYIWAGFRGGVMRITPRDNHIDTILFDAFSTNEVLSMMEANGHIWISTTDGLWLVDMKTLKARNLYLSDRRFLSMFFDKKENCIYLGEVDGFAITTPEVVDATIVNRPIIATALYVNSQLMEPESQSIRYISQIELNYRQNNISLELSDLPYSLEEKSKLVYRLEDVDQRWNLLNSNSSRISYNNLSHGTYHLLVSKLDITGKPSESRYSLELMIHPPWYYTIWAKSVYILLLMSLAGWTINFFRVKNRLKIERIEKEKITEQSRMKMDFLTNLSHELKTPLSMIIAPISRILPGIKGQHLKTQLKLVQHNAMKLNSLIHQMLDFNRIDSENNSLLILSRIELVSFARKLFSVFKEAEKENGISFRFVSNQEKIYLDLDVIKWESILTNLLSNAVKYTSADGTITLLLNYSEEAGELELSVADTGTGIPAKDIPYIFQRFFQSSKTAGKKEGTGIGLYLVKTYTELHGGKVSITSEENTGTTITIILPLHEHKHEIIASSVKSGTGSEAETLDKNQPLILIVDDNPEIVAFIRDMLQPQYRCQIAEDGQTGLDLCFELLPDLIISDVMMPGMNGLEMCQKIRKHVPTSTIPIILLTAKDDKETELESIQLNVDTFISKPFEPDILLSRIDQLIRKNKKMEAKMRMEALATPKEIEAVSYDEKFLSNITHIIEDHLADSDLNVTALCEISGINNKQIYRKLKQLTGMTPVEYIKSVRMKKAAMLLRQQKFSVAEVMYMVGFSNHSYFSKCFKAEFNKPPWQYKEES